MRFGVLGPLEVSVEGRSLSLGGAKQRALLAILLLHANEAVSRDRLIEAVWGETPPPSAAGSLDTYVYRLRKLLGPERLARRAGGYVLHVEPGDLDVDEFDRLLTSAAGMFEAGDCADAVVIFVDALALWRGPALADVLYEPFAAEWARQLDERRLEAIEQRIETELAMGRDKELVLELKQLVREHPLRERMLASLMLALYRSGRQADALAAFREARVRLVEQLGLEPDPETRELERRILQHDPTLAAKRHAARTGPPPNRLRVPVAAGLGLMALLIIGSVLLGSRTASARHTLAPSQNGLVAVDTRSGQVVAASALDGTPDSVTASTGSVWVADPGADAVSRRDETGAQIDLIPIGGEPGGIARGGGAIWVASTVGATIVRIDPTTETVTQRISLPGSRPAALTFGDGRVWVADSVARELFALDPSTGAPQRTVGLDLQPSAIAVGRGAIWVAGYNDATVEELNPASGRLIARIRVGDGPAALAFQDGSLWVANSLDATVTRIDPATLATTATISVGNEPTALVASGGGGVWVADAYSDTVSRIDPRRDRVDSSVAVGGTPTSLTVSGNRLWVAVAAETGSHPGGTLVIEALASSGPMTPASIDPAFYSGVNNPQFMGLAYDSLVTFQQSPGAAGLRLVPDLALSIPAPTDGGTTYAFDLRPGIHYSDGQRLRADDFRRAFERLFRVRGIGSSLYTDIAGAAACARQPRTCDLSQGIVTNNEAGTVTFHLSVPDPEFIYELTEQAYAAPIPPGTPDHGSRAVPGTGPYMITTVNDRQIRFARNPFFREWSHAAQPAGNPDSIVWQTAPSAKAAVRAIEQGRADWLDGEIPASQYRQLELQHPALLHANSLFGVEFIAMNTNLAPFNDLEVRQALNYAIDRAKIAQLYGGPSFATPTCQVIAPGLPGYRRYCPYTLHPRPDGSWTAPDLARARRLVAESGTYGESIVVRDEPDQGYVPPTTPQYVAGVLRELGYHVRVHLAPLATVTQVMRTHFQLDVDGDWAAVYPDPSSYVPQFFSCGGGLGNGYYCNPRIDNEMQHATQLEASDPPKAVALWAAVDRQLTDDAVWVPTVTPQEIELTSSRLHNYQYNPVWGFLADQSWIH
jgi:YVTN family beta-propeller protein